MEPRSLEPLCLPSLRERDKGLHATVLRAAVIVLFIKSKSKGGAVRCGQIGTGQRPGAARGGDVQRSTVSG